MPVSTIILLVLIGIAAGVLSGFVGVGGGLIIVPALIYLLGLGQHAAQGTSLAMMLPPIGILAVMNYHKSGDLDWRYALILAAAFIIGGYLGSRWSLALPEQVVRKIFGLVMLLGALKLIFSK